MASYFQQLDNEYGSATRTLFKDYATQNRKLGNMTARKDFLLRCRRTGVFPSHITNVFRCVFSLIEENSPYLQELDQHVNRFKKAILNVEIKHTFHKINRLKRNLSDLKIHIGQAVPEDECARFIENQESFYAKYVRDSANRTDRKYRLIIDRSLAANAGKTPSHNAKAIYNSTDVAIPQEVQLILGMGSKFALPYTDMNELPIYHLIADVENIIQTNKREEIQDRNRCAVANQIQNFLHAEKERGRHDPSTNFFRTSIKATKDFLKEHQAIIVIEADKGNRTVVMKRDEYEMELQRMIDDDDTYRKLT